MEIALVIIFTALYNAFILAGTAYLIVTYNWSPWWFLFTALLISSPSIERKEKKKENE